MRLLPSFVVAAAAASALLAGGACSRTEPAPGVLMVAIQTDLVAGKTHDIQAVGLYVRDLDRNRTLFQLTEPVAPDGTVRFPATLAIIGRNNPGASVRIRVVGFRSGEAQVMREAVTTIPHDRVAMLSLPLRWVNYGKTKGKMPPGGGAPAFTRALAGESAPADDPATDPFGIIFNAEASCRGDTTYIDGACAPWAIDSATLPDFVEADVFGGGTADGGGACFDTERCFAASTPVAFDEATCLAPRPPGDFTLGVKLPPGSDLGACAGDGCFIPLDPESDEGWRTEGGPATAGAIRVSRGTCDRIRSGHLRLVTTAICGRKAALAPLCGEASTVGPATDLPVTDGGALDAGDALDVGVLPDGAPIVPETLAVASTPTALALDGNDLYYTTLDAKLWKLDANGPANQTPQLVKDLSGDAGVVQPEARIAASGGRVIVGIDLAVYVIDATGTLNANTLSGFPQPVVRGVAISGNATYFAHGSGGSGGGGVFRCPAGGCVVGVAGPVTVQQFYDGIVRELAYDPQTAALFTNVSDPSLCASGSVCLMRLPALGTTNDPKTAVVSTGLPFLGVTNISVDPAPLTSVYFTVGHDVAKSPGAPDTIAVISKAATNGTATTFTTDQLTAATPGDVRIRHQLANDSNYLYWTSSPGGVFRKSITAAPAQTQTIKIADEPGARAVAVGGAHVFWTTALPGGAIRRMALAGVAK
jgi:hypothetical protein